jgi:hypothetical protein
LIYQETPTLLQLYKAQKTFNLKGVNEVEKPELEMVDSID